MDFWLSYLAVFAVGFTAGVLLNTFRPGLTNAKSKRTEQVAARSRILAGIKEKHDEEILDAAFRTTEAIKGELDKSLQTLQRTLNAIGVTNPAPVAPLKPVIQLSNPVESKSSPA